MSGAAEELDPPLLERLWREMVRVRRLDERLTALARQGRIGFYGAALGQEAVPVAAGLAIAPSDWVFPALRENAIMLVRGYPLSRYLAQLYGSAGDPMKGRQMPNHMASRAVRQVSWSSSIATQLPHAVGTARALKCAGSPEIVLAFLGDGATSHPDFHAALNLAGLWRVPIVFVCQNNQYAISVPVARQTASRTLSIKASAYGFEGHTLDGNDAPAVFCAISSAVARARAGRGPTLLECVTYRRGPHSTSDDPSRYRPPGEAERWAERDPLARLSAELSARGLGDGARAARWIEELDQELDSAIAEVEREGPPPRESLFEDVFERPPWHLIEQRAALRASGARASNAPAGGMR